MVLHALKTIFFQRFISFQEEQNQIQQTNVSTIISNQYEPATLLSQTEQNLQASHNFEATASGKDTTKNSCPCSLHLVKQCTISAPSLNLDKITYMLCARNSSIFLLNHYSSSKFNLNSLPDMSIPRTFHRTRLLLALDKGGNRKKVSLYLYIFIYKSTSAWLKSITFIKFLPFS